MINDKMTNLFRPNNQVCQLQRYIKNVNRSSMRCGRVTLEQYFRCPLSQSLTAVDHALTSVLLGWAA